MKKLKFTLFIGLLLGMMSCSSTYTMMQQKTVVTSVKPVMVIGVTKATPLNLKVGDTITMITKVRNLKSDKITPPTF